MAFYCVGIKWLVVALAGDATAKSSWHGLSLIPCFAPYIRSGETADFSVRWHRLLLFSTKQSLRLLKTASGSQTDSRFQSESERTEARPPLIDNAEALRPSNCFGGAVHQRNLVRIGQVPTIQLKQAARRLGS